MTLESMVVSRDWQEVSVLECILGSLHIGVRVESDAERARARFFKSKVDAVIVDRDLSGTDRFLSTLKSSRCNGSSVPVVLLSGAPDRHDLPASGATFFFEKPVSVEEAVRTLSAARNLMLNGRLRYHREALNMPVSLSFGVNKKISVQLANVSQGGIGIRVPGAVELRGPIQMHFQLPGEGESVEARGELAWADASGNAGLRFVEVPAQLQRSLQLWLEKQYFAH
jgi:CheY-like chemotaxis protein